MWQDLNTRQGCGYHRLPGTPGWVRLLSRVRIATREQRPGANPSHLHHPGERYFIEANRENWRAEEPWRSAGNDRLVACLVDKMPRLYAAN